jgi:protein-disulfide isomerase
MSDKIERVLSVALTAAALFFAVILAKREFFDDDGRHLPGEESGPPKRVSNWAELRASGLTLWAPKSAVSVVEFADLECPACKQFHARLKETAAELHTPIGLIMVHFPLSVHRFAKPAARALECAYSSGAGARFVDVAYAKQDSFGLKPWLEYAKEAGIHDTSAFAWCVQDTARIQRVEEGRRLGEAMKLQGTPAIVINGWQFRGVPNDAQLRAAIKALSHGQAPPGA